MSLQDWARNAWLIEHQSSPQEIADLLALADRDLNDCRAKGLSEDWQMAIAYNAALQSATAALLGDDLLGDDRLVRDYLPPNRASFSRRCENAPPTNE